MKLKQVRVDGFRSVKEPLKLFVDPKVTILIGANDHGKTTLLEAIRCLNDDRTLSKDDENWDTVDQGKPVLSFSFALDEDERAQLKIFTDAFVEKEYQKQLAEASAPGAPAALAQPTDATSTTDSTVADPATKVVKVEWDHVQYPMPLTYEVQKAVGGPLGYVSNDFYEQLPEAVNYLHNRLPRIELFAAVPQLMDVVTLPELDKADQEFMQGIFRYARIWDEHSKLFVQTPATDKRLEQASELFTTKIRAEWKQGENLSFRFQHAGQNGNQIELLIRDPAVSNRFVRPSERSAGFSAFFAMSMRMLARTEANPANKYIFLFDEPGTALHPAGQVNLQRVFERLSQQDQIVYATHSLFMVNHNRP